MAAIVSTSRRSAGALRRETTTGAALPLLDIKPTIAYKVHDRLSVGLGLDIYTFSSLIGEGQFEQRLIGAPLGGVQGLREPAENEAELRRRIDECNFWKEIT